MATDMAELSKVDSAIDTLSSSPSDKKIFHRRASSSVSGVFNMADLEKDGTNIEIAIETQKLNWKINTSPTSVEDKEVLKKLLCSPPVKKIDLTFPLGGEVTARNLKGVTIKDALEAIYKRYKKKADDELDGKPILAGFEWDRKECYTRFIVHTKKEGQVMQSKKKGKKEDKEEAAE